MIVCVLFSADRSYVCFVACSYVFLLLARNIYLLLLLYACKFFCFMLLARLTCLCNVRTCLGLFCNQKTLKKQPRHKRNANGRAGGHVFVACSYVLLFFVFFPRLCLGLLEKPFFLILLLLLAGMFFCFVVDCSSVLGFGGE